MADVNKDALKRQRAQAAARLKQQKAKQRAQRRTSARKRARRVIVGKILVCLLVVALCVALALVVGTSDYEASAIGWVPLVAVLAAILGAFLYLQAIKRGLKVMEKSELGDCRRGQDITFTVRFRNTTPLFFFRIEAHIFIADMYGKPEHETSTTLTLSPFEVYDMDFSAKFDHIGTYGAGISQVVVTDYLRLFTATIPAPKHREVQVVPMIQPIERIEFSNEAVLENARAAKAALADSLDYASVRDYVPGDPLKTVHWKLSARTGHYLTRLYEVYTNPGLCIVMDFFGPSNNTSTLMSMFDAVVESAFSIARFGQSHGMETEVHWVASDGERAQTQTWDDASLPQLVERMPRMSNNNARQVDALSLYHDEASAQYGQNNLVICTANLSAEMVSAVIEAKARRRSPMMIAVVPNNLVGRERDTYCASLARLDVANIGYIVLSRSEELAGVVA